MPEQESQKPKMVVWDKGKPVATTDVQEKKRLEGRIAIIDKVLKEMGYPEGYAKYQEYIDKMVKKDFKKYMTFLKKVDELSKECGV